MPWTRNWTAQLSIVVAIIATIPSGIWAADTSRKEAQEFEQAGQWDKACEVYARLLSQDRQQPELRERLQICVRRLHQARRHRDPVYRDNLLSLPVSQALALYVEILNKLNGQYADRDKVPIERLYQNGLDEFCAALSDPTFLKDYLGETWDADATRLAVADIRAKLRNDYAARSISGTKDGARRCAISPGKRNG